tara:strand:- start:3383 stop:3835 length:453 start_codon:yes stop_codon:yes gene_type:complete
MPKKKKRSKNCRPTKSKGLIYANASNEEKYAKVSKSQGGKPPKFECALLNGQIRICSLPSGTAREASRNGIRKVKPDHWILVQPLSSDIDGVQEIITVYTNHQAKRLEKEGKLSIVMEDSKEEKNIMYEDEKECPDDRVIDDHEINIDDL